MDDKKAEACIKPFMERVYKDAQESIEGRRPYLSTFLLPDVLLEALLSEAHQLRSRATVQRRERNVLSTITATDSKLADAVKHNLSIVTYDKVDKAGIIEMFFKESTILMQKLLPSSGAYPPTDALSPANVNYMRAAGSSGLEGREDDDELGDHFDGVDFVVVVLLQKSTAGGEMRVCKENVPENWTEDERQAFAKQEKDESYPNSLLWDPPSGGLYILNGRCNMHAVLPPKGDDERISLVMSFYKTPDGSYEKHFGSFYGATTKGPEEM